MGEDRSFSWSLFGRLDDLAIHQMIKGDIICLMCYKNDDISSRADNVSYVIKK